jgi:hypothetical protein
VITLHQAGEVRPDRSQLCARCGIVLIETGDPDPWPVGAWVERTGQDMRQALSRRARQLPHSDPSAICRRDVAVWVRDGSGEAAHRETVPGTSAGSCSGSSPRPDALLARPEDPSLASHEPIGEPPSGSPPEDATCHDNMRPLDLDGSGGRSAATWCTPWESSAIAAKVRGVSVP